MAKYTVRTEQVDEGWVAHIDQDGLVCIRQPNLPGLEGFFASEKDAKTWADGHAADLEAAYEASIVAAQQAEEKRVKELEALQAQIDTAEALKALVAKLANPSA